MRVNMRPIKQVLGTYASKWMFVYTKYLSDQVSEIFLLVNRALFNVVQSNFWGIYCIEDLTIDLCRASVISSQEI